MELPEFVGLIHSLAQPSLSLKDNLVRTVHRVSSALTDFFRWQKQRFLNRYKDDPIMSCYMADGWSSRIESRVKRYVGSSIVYRGSEVKHEFLLQLEIMKTLQADNTCDMIINFSPPIGLGLGRKDSRLLWGHGPKGYCIYIGFF